MSGWIGVDLDGTLAVYDHWRGAEHIGEPVTVMVERVKRWLEEGRDIRIFTARLFPLGVTEGGSMQEIRTAMAAKRTIQTWCERYIGKVLPITCVKDYGMIELWDDRAVQIEKNTGARADGKVD